MNNDIQELVWDLEDKIMDSKNNRSKAAQVFRNAQCLRGDFRNYAIFTEALNYLTSSFKRQDGTLRFANTNMHLGNIVNRHLNLSIYADTKMHLGACITSTLVKHEYVILRREEFFTIEEIKINKKLTSIRLQPYQLEIGKKFFNIKYLGKERLGISTTKFPIWLGQHRVVDGVKEGLIKGKVKVAGKNQPFLKAVNNLEQVKWEINPNVAKISIQLKEKLTDTWITLTDKNGKDVIFDTKDIERTSINEKYHKVKLFKEGTPFNPHKGNSTTVKNLENKLSELERRSSKLKPSGKVKKLVEQEISQLKLLYEKHNTNWLAKQTCLRTQSKANRELAILNTIHGTEEYLGWEGYQFYLSCFLDFRSRIYSKDPYFSYQSSDLARGHLQFAEAKPMTSTGYEKLLVHTANSYNQSYTITELKEIDWTETNYITDLTADGIPDISVDKMSLVDRANWAEEHLTLFLDIVADPMETLDIWFNAEKPWVFLSLCYEIVAYVSEGEGYMSKIPIAIDGASNGTQHLAAMSKDEVAGKMVGLIPREKPIDFYIVVAKGILNRNIDNDLSAILANIPMKLIRKGISKRGTMTKAYDAGVKCIANIIYTDCYDAGMTTKYGITKAIAQRLSKDLVDTYNSLCSGPVAVKDYLQALVKHRLIEMKFRDVRWMTPSGFPVISSKWITDKRQIRIKVLDETIGLVYREATDRPAIHEIISGISPNYVHSMDASHMSLVINKLHSEGITSFGAIHDSYSVHADDVDRLLEVTKEVFVEMYDLDVFKDMKRQFISNDNSFDFEAPEGGSLDLSGLKKSEYFFC